MNRGDIVLVKFPFTDLSSSKVRPALVVSVDTYNQASKDSIFIFISSNISSQENTDVLVEKSHSEFKMTGLIGASIIKVDKIAVLEKSLASRKLGKAGPQLLKAVESRLKNILDLN